MKERLSVIEYIVNSPEVLVQNIKNPQTDSGPVPGCMSTRNSPQEITKSEDVWYCLHHTDMSFKFDSIHKKDFILLVITLFFKKVLELN